MRRPYSADSDAAEAEESLHEAEMLQLQRDHRLLESQKQAYTVETNDEIRKHTYIMDQLEAEREELSKYIKLADSSANENRDRMAAFVLKDMSQQQDNKRAEIEAEKQQIAELDGRLREWERKVKDQNKNMGGAGMSRAHTQKQQKTLRVLENRLEQALKKFNSQLVTNQKMREQIDSLRVDRVRYDALRERLEDQLEEKRREKARIIETSTQAYESRDEAQQKMIGLKEKSDKDRQTHEAEMKELVRLLDHDKKLKEFMGIKTKERREDGTMVEWREKKLQYEAEKKNENTVETADTYEYAFARIKEVTGEDDLELLVAKFIENEERNFALFNYVNEQNNRIEILHEQIQEIKVEMAQFESEGVRLEDERRAILRELEGQLNSNKKQADFIEDKSRRVEKIVDQLRFGVKSIFNKINCDRTGLDDMLGPEPGVTKNNILTYLGIIEDRTNQLLAMQAYLLYRDNDYDRTALASLSAEATKLAIAPPLTRLEPPSIKDEWLELGDDDEGRPFTRAELENKVVREMRTRKDKTTIKKETTKAGGANTQVDLGNKKKSVVNFQKTA